jgi:putative glycosyltransferase
VFLIDVDLEEPPELLQRFCRRWTPAMRSTSSGVQTRRRGGWWERLSGAAFYRILNLGARIQVIPDTLLARLMNRRFVDALVSLPEQPVSLDILSAVAGFRHLAIPAPKASSSATTYSFTRKVSPATKAIVSHHTWLPWCLGIVRCQRASLASC